MAKRGMQNSNKRDLRETRRRQERNKKYLTWGGLGLVVLAALGAIIWLAMRPSPVAAVSGDLVRVGASDHIPTGNDPGPFPTDPPAGGKHYAEQADPGFYEEADTARFGPYPAGYLVHSLEHGYIIYWYNCSANPEIDCEAMKADIRKVMDEVKGHKVIAFPWPSQPEPLVMTSWDRILRLDQVDLDKMRGFYKANLNKAPEPMAK